VGGSEHTSGLQLKMIYIVVEARLLTGCFQRAISRQTNVIGWQRLMIHHRPQGNLYDRGASSKLSIRSQCSAASSEKK
jgi:hypothetical protein